MYRPFNTRMHLVLASPCAQVVPALLRILPPREDFDEVRPVVRCLLLLLQLAPTEPAVRRGFGTAK